MKAGGSAGGAGGARRGASAKDAINDPDPMMQALYENILRLEKILLTLKANVANFVKASNYLGLSMQTLATNIGTFCSEDEALHADAAKYGGAVGAIVGSGGSHRAQMITAVENKVLEPLVVNLTVLADIKRRMMERETLRKAQNKRLGLSAFTRGAKDKKMSPELDKMTSELFEELTALYQHRFDFVRGPYQALKKVQHAFFVAGGASLEALQAPAPRPSTAVEPPKAPPPKVSKSAAEMLAESPSIEDSKRFREARAEISKGFRSEMSKRSESVKKLLARRSDGAGADKGKPREPEEVVVALPEKTEFNPDADRPSAGTAYLRLGKARGSDAIGTRLQATKEPAASASNFQGASEIGSFKINIKGRTSRSRAPTHGDEVPMKIAPSFGDEVPMKIAPSFGDEVPMKIAPSFGDEVPMKIAPCPGEVPMKIAPSASEAPMRIAPAPSPRTTVLEPPRPQDKRRGSKKKKEKKKKRDSKHSALSNADSEGVGSDGAALVRGEDLAAAADDDFGDFTDFVAAPDKAPPGEAKAASQESGASPERTEGASDGEARPSHAADALGGHEGGREDVAERLPGSTTEPEVRLESAPRMNGATAALEPELESSVDLVEGDTRVDLPADSDEGVADADEGVAEPEDGLEHGRPTTNGAASAGAALVDNDNVGKEEPEDRLEEANGISPEAVAELGAAASEAEAETKAKESGEPEQRDEGGPQFGHHLDQDFGDVKAEENGALELGQDFGDVEAEENGALELGNGTAALGQGEEADAEVDAEVEGSSEPDVFPMVQSI